MDVGLFRVIYMGSSYTEDKALRLIKSQIDNDRAVTRRAIYVQNISLRFESYSLSYLSQKFPIYR